MLRDEVPFGPIYCVQSLACARSRAPTQSSILAICYPSEMLSFSLRKSNQSYAKYINNTEIRSHLPIRKRNIFNFLKLCFLLFLGIFFFFGLKQQYLMMYRTEYEIDIRCSKFQLRFCGHRSARALFRYAQYMQVWFPLHYNIQQQQQQSQ